MDQRMPTGNTASNTENVLFNKDHNYRKRCSMKHIFHFISQLIIPLVLAIFTIVVTFDQRNQNRLQIAEDRRLAELQRQQDLNISHQQRMHDKQLAVEKREADDLNAEIQRNMTHDQRMYEINIEQERYKKEHEKYLDTLLLSYYTEISELFQKTNEKPSSLNSVILSLAHAKTLNVIEQIGSTRAAQLLMFLYRSGQLSMGNNSLDLNEARLNNIDLRNQKTLINIYISGAYLNNASFVGQNLSYGNFRNARLNRANFTGSICIGTIFDGASLIEADFSHSNIRDASFIRVDLRQATFYKAISSNSYFEHARMQQTNFSHTNFKFNRIGKQGFVDSNLAASDFRDAHLQEALFIFCNMTHIDFTNADLRRANLTGSLVSHSLFYRADLGFAILSATNFSYANFSIIKCLGTITNISACKLHQALTLENALLPNGSIGLPSIPFLNGEGQPYCQFLVLGMYNTCVFAPFNVSINIEMSQTINLISYEMLIKARRAKATVVCSVGYDTHIFVTQYDENNRELVVSESIQYRWTELLKSRTVSLKLSILFANPLNYDHSWCEYVKFHIEPDYMIPDTYLRYPWITF